MTNVRSSTVAKDFNTFNLNRENYGYKIQIDGGEIVNFRLPGSPACWCSEITATFALPEAVLRDGEIVEDHFGRCIVKYIAALETVPYENISGYEENEDIVRDAIKGWVAELERTYVATNTRPALRVWLEVSVSDTELPMRISITPVVRGSFAA